MNQRAERPSQKRLQILDADELEALYGRPRFTPEERLHSFTLTPAEHDARALLRSVPSQLYFMLQLAYFKAKQLFFAFTFAEVADDVAYLLAHAGLAAPDHTFAPLNKRTILHHRQLILDLFRYRLCTALERQQLVARAQQAARMSSKPIYVFRELLQFLIEQRIVLPGYTVLQELVGKVLTEEQQRLIALMQTQLAPTERAAFDTLFADTDGLYTLTRLKHEPKDFSLGEMRQEIRRADQLRPLYQLASRIVPQLEISNEGIKYYASLVSYYAVFRLQQLDPWLVYLYLLCFVTHRYQQCHDHLLTCFIHTVTQSIEEAKATVKEQLATQRLERNADMLKAGQILKLFTSNQIAATTPFQTVRDKAFAILDRHKLDQIADYISTKVYVDEQASQWAHLEGQAKRLKRHLRPILMAVDLTATRADAPLMAAMQFLKTTFAKGRSLGQLASDTFPTQFMPVRLKRSLYALDESGQKRLISDRYEVLVYQRLRNTLESGDLFCQHSVRFRSFEDDLISDQDWQDKETMIAQAGLLILLQPIQNHLAALERQLEARIAAVNQRIAAGENTYFKIKRRGDRTRWTLQYPHL